jgi:two-component system nitrate/nitrite response regulator NarL
VHRSPIILVHSNRLFLEGLARICECGHFHCRCAGTSWERFSAEIRDSEQIPVFIVGGCNLTATVGAIRREYRLAPIVVVGESGEADEIARALAAGANCYLRETINSDLLLKTLDLLTQKEVILSTPLMRQSSSRANGSSGGDGDSSHPLAAKEASMPPIICGNDANPAITLSSDALPPETRLSAQEKVILQGLVEGAPNKVIANRLHITEATVKVHVKAILRKIPAKNRTQAAIWAVKHLPAQIRDGKELRSKDLGFV